MKEVDRLKGYQSRYEMEILRIINENSKKVIDNPEALTCLSHIKWELQNFKEQKPKQVMLL